MKDTLALGLVGLMATTRGKAFTLLSNSDLSIIQVISIH